MATVRDEEAYHLEDQVGHLLRRANQRHLAIFQDLVGDSQITATQFAALVKLHDEGEISQNHLGRLTAMDPATIQGVIRRLIDRALIEGRDDPNDRRRTLLSLTPEGKALVRELVKNGGRISEATLEPLSPEERKTLLHLLQRIA
jgi:DNA-binding MarR family transcriptional regulator